MSIDFWSTNNRIPSSSSSSTSSLLFSVFSLLSTPVAEWERSSMDSVSRKEFDSSHPALRGSWQKISKNVCTSWRWNFKISYYNILQLHQGWIKVISHNCWKVYLPIARRLCTLTESLVIIIVTATTIATTATTITTTQTTTATTTETTTTTITSTTTTTRPYYHYNYYY